MRNIAICDDEPLYRERLAQSVRAHGNGQAAQLQLFDSPAALLQAVHMHGYAPDIAVLDIQMDEMDRALSWQSSSTRRCRNVRSSLSPPSSALQPTFTKRSTPILS